MTERWALCSWDLEDESLHQRRKKMRSMGNLTVNAKTLKVENLEYGSVCVLFGLTCKQFLFVWHLGHKLYERCSLSEKEKRNIGEPDTSKGPNRKC